ncbi:hypothetical protein [Legionella hackeliae]|uniref:Uncharacterized protein n=1 Tax=Legionella hackeliae TaxID=449 RepID=A0A0A8UKT9_LEGHA|nr:hypothetical protein [Legionella hackeliae]KTD13508.1 hypothetical protein Lhac_0892 [Legionella hackeliae]CEK09353.1 exported protein of unknown function [Legionella hackeliae]STX49259.1 Uncharacterised protein [Legionella hackeliae]
MYKIIFSTLLFLFLIPAQAATADGPSMQEEVNAQDDCIQRILKPCIEKCESNDNQNCVQLCQENAQNECRQAGE